MHIQTMMTKMRKVHGNKYWQEHVSMGTVSTQLMGLPIDIVIWKTVWELYVKLMCPLLAQQFNLWESGLSRVHKEMYKRIFVTFSILIARKKRN